MDYSKVHWLIDSALLDRDFECDYPLLNEAALEAGCPVYVTTRNRIADTPDPNIPFAKDACVIAHGSIQFIRQIQKHCSYWCPGAYSNNNTKTFSAFSAYYGEHMLNNEFYILPYGEFERRGLKDGQEVFIKPNSGAKEFTGKVIRSDNFSTEINSMNQIERVAKDSLCVIAPVKNIRAEFRYIIVDGVVISGSEYSWDDDLAVNPNTLPVCDELAQTIAEFHWQPDIAYICDIAHVDDTAKIIELNSFSSSGLYANNTREIVKAVSMAAWKEYSGDE